MRQFVNSSNPFITREDMVDSLESLVRPLKDYFIRNNTRIHIANTGANEVADVTDFELFSRILWGLIPAIGEDRFDDIWEKIHEGMKWGFDVDHPDYFGDPVNYGQMLVEMAVFAYGLMINKEKMWDSLDDVTKANYIKWLKKANECQYHNCNWKFFNILVNLGLQCIGEQMDKEKVDGYLDDIDTYYSADGWYYDGEPGGAHADYYVPFAIHFYSLLYVKQMQEVDKERCQKYIDRVREFMQSFIYWFSSDGSALPYGRSLNYRFAQGALFSAVLYSGVDVGIDKGVIKGIIMRHMRYWFDQPILNAQGHLTLGYIYQNMNFPESYMGQGSPYWALKIYMLLALDKDDEFWRIEEQPLPAMDEVKDFDAPKLRLVRRDRSSHIMAYNAGNLHTNAHNHVEAKYEKFVYSNVFGFSVSRSNAHLFHGAYDSMLAVADENGYWRPKQKSISRAIHDGYIHTKWSPYPYVDIDTYIIAGNPWHVRIHIVETQQDIYIAEGGFALGLETDGTRQKIEYIKNTEGVMAVGELAYSGIYNVLGYDRAEIVRPNANTNSHNPMTCLPTLMQEITRGRYVLISYVLGDLDSNTCYSDMTDLPEYQLKDNKIVIDVMGKVVEIDTNED